MWLSGLGRFEVTVTLYFFSGFLVDQVWVRLCSGLLFVCYFQTLS